MFAEILQFQMRLSLLESVLAMAYDCEDAIDWKEMLQYIHFNRHSNTLLIEELKARVETLEANVDSSSSGSSSSSRGSSASPKQVGLPIPAEGSHVMLRRKHNAGNPAGFFDKTYSEYQAGFEDNESWLGLEELHSLTSHQPFKLLITMTDWDGEKYVAVYEQFKVGSVLEDYVLTVSGFKSELSTLGDSMFQNDGEKFSAKDRDNDGWDGHCAKQYRGGWWYAQCTYVHPTGMHTDGKGKLGGKQIYYADGGKRGYGEVSWAEAEFLLVP